MNRHFSVAARSVTLWLLTTALAGGAVRLLLDDLLRVTSPGLSTGSVDGVTALCEGALIVCVGWVWLATSAVVAEALFCRCSEPTNARPRLPGVPQAWRRVLLIACGVAVTVGVALPAGATPGSVQLDPGGHRGGRHGRGDPATATLDGLPMPQRATDRTATSHPVRSSTPAPVPAPAPTPALVVVRPGDSLWSIAAGLAPADVAGTWQEIYHLNRVVVGDDPDLIVPGQRLTLPSS